MAHTFEKVSVIGAGSWGTAVANLFADQGCQVLLWGRDADVVKSVNASHENPKYLQGLPLNNSLKATEDLDKALRFAEVIVCAIPTQQIRKVFGPKAALLKDRPIINTSKGIEIESLAHVSEIFHSLSPSSLYAVLSGPTFAQEVAQRLPAAITLACKDKSFAESVQRRLSNQYFRVYTSDDVVGVEIAGALKNVVAIATGVVSGLQLGYNAQAAIINRGIAEIMRMARQKGANPMTFMGLAGMGDLILTCTGPLSRNRNLGLKLGQGKKLDQIQKELGGVAEGYFTTRAVHEMAQREKIDMPITTQVYAMLYEGKSAQEALVQLMGRDLKEEGS